MDSHFIWYELLTTDPAAAAEFYRAVIGWSCSDSGQPGMDYRLFRMGDETVGGLMALPPGAEQSGMTPAWLGYISVANVDEAVSRLTSAGGQLHMPAMEVPGVGRFAMVGDPQGAIFYVMTPVGEAPSVSFAPGRPGHGGWHELHARDGATAFEFYARQFGWSQTDALAMGEMGHYRLFNTGAGEPIGGMMTNPNLPRPVWFYYFNVDDIDAAQARLTAAGGKVLFGPNIVPGDSWIINAQDPQGAMFQLVGPRS